MFKCLFRAVRSTDLKDHKSDAKVRLAVDCVASEAGHVHLILVVAAQFLVDEQETASDGAWTSNPLLNKTSLRWQVSNYTRVDFVVNINVPELRW